MGLFTILLHCNFRADDALALKLLVNGKCHAVGLRRVIEKLGMDFTDFPYRGKIDGDGLTNDFFLLDDKIDEPPDGGCLNRKILLTVINRD